MDPIAPGQGVTIWPHGPGAGGAILPHCPRAGGQKRRINWRDRKRAAVRGRNMQGMVAAMAQTQQQPNTNDKVESGGSRATESTAGESFQRPRIENETKGQDISEVDAQPIRIYRRNAREKGATSEIREKMYAAMIASSKSNGNNPCISRGKVQSIQKSLGG